MAYWVPVFEGILLFLLGTDIIFLLGLAPWDGSTTTDACHSTRSYLSFCWEYSVGEKQQEEERRGEIPQHAHAKRVWREEVDNQRGDVDWFFMTA
ncbi:hypothetical protein Micbo1qcDRAFT_67041 [Microdochium bolleyi]|uniref:Uncharacterized protein n=1 Tax=Microdochium bolleyi TaxID=196109 RepID=A0A136J155_9PEZI|nr:hypothetical protein Micbo1qcDRAFT_67041 [Microdochium bolleyi]